MEFTNEQKDFVEYFKNNNITFKGRDITEIFPEVLKPERKKIRVEIEYLYEQENTSLPLTANSLETHFENATELKNVKVTELPEGNWTDEEIKNFLKRFCFDFDINITADTIEEAFTNFKAERKSK